MFLKNVPQNLHFNQEISAKYKLKETENKIYFSNHKHGPEEKDESIQATNGGIIPFILCVMEGLIYCQY